MFHCWPNGTHSNRFYVVAVVVSVYFFLLCFCFVCLSVFVVVFGGFCLLVCLLACLFLIFFKKKKSFFFGRHRQVLLVPNFKEAAECDSQATTHHGDLYTQTWLLSFAELRLQTEYKTNGAF